MKTFYLLLFTAYLLVLLWLVLFKFSYEPLAAIHDLNLRSVNFIPFARTTKSEMIANLIAFIPFGVMLGVCFKRATFLYKLAVIFAFSLTVEIIQFALAIGVTDVTDLIMNTLGGLIGLTAYALLSKLAGDKHLDRFILIVGTLILVAFLYLRIFVFIVKY